MAGILFFILLLLVIFVPGYGLLRYEYILVGFVVIVCLLQRRYSYVNRFRSEFIIIFLMFISASLSLLSQLLTGHGFVWRDAMIFSRLLYYLFLILFMAMICGRIKNYAVFENILIVTSFMMVILSLAQYFNLFSINDMMLPRVGERFNWLREGVSWRRVLGTLNNPNYWGLTINLFLVMVAYIVFWKKKIIHLPLFILLFVSVILTGSRTALISCLGAIFIGGLFISFRGNEKPSVAVVSIVFFIVFGLLLGIGFREYYEDPNRFSAYNIGTLYARMDHWLKAWTDVSSSFIGLLIGQGPRKSEIVIYGDNAYIRTLRDYGILGLLLYISLLFVMGKKIVRLLKNRVTKDYSLSAGLILLLLAWVIFEFAADAWYFSQAVSVFLGIYVFVSSIEINRQQATGSPK